MIKFKFTVIHLVCIGFFLLISFNTYSQSLTKAMDTDCDTIGFPLAASYFVAAKTPGGGWSCGNNEYGVTADAQYFDGYGLADAVLGCRILFAHVAGNDNNFATIAIWKDKNKKPSSSSPVFTQDITLGTIREAVDGKYYTDVDFNNPYIITGPFYLGVIFPTLAGDTVALSTSAPGDASGDNAWMLMKGAWSTFKVSFGGGLNADLVVFPMVCKLENGISDNKSLLKENNINIYPNPADNSINIDFSNSINELFSINIYNSFGELVKSIRNNELKITNHAFQVNTSELNQGIYYININSKDKSIIRKLSIVR